MIKGGSATVAERAALGKAARENSPRSVHADWAPAAGREDPVEILERQAESRVPELVPIRYGRMLASPFTFFRGAAAVMAMDLAETPDSGLTVQACGDAHLSNFGIFSAPDRRLVFDLNDFDETLPGPWEWDVKRLAASFEIGGRDRGFKRKERRAAVLRTVRAYRQAMAAFAGMRNLEVWYARIDVARLFEDLKQRANPKQAKRFEKEMGKAKRKDSLRAMERLSTEIDGELQIAADPPLLVPIEDLVPESRRHHVEEPILALLAGYRESLSADRRHLFDSYSYVHLARKVVGVGSVGTRAWVVLLVGRDNSDPLFLQVKEAEASVLESYAGASGYENHGERVVQGQWLMQAASDVLLGWLPAIGLVDGRDRDFYVRQLWDGKRSIDVETLLPQGFAEYGQACGWTLARAHARSGDRIAIAGYLGNGDSFDEAIADFSAAYADQNQRDYAALADAADGGRIEAETDI
ncbi:MAG: hypothetical protein QOD60_2091 [Solirubrobacterales bacterium]|jgi:uncharacterized protein (DUF2252 family)|nr:hypothetical protein [Solirubrobacterales bacterium]